MKMLDCRGLVCPEPVIRTRAALAEPGVTELLVIVDNDAALGNVSRYASNHGFTVAREDRDGLYYLTLTPAGSTPSSTAAAAAPVPAGDAECALGAGSDTDGSVVLITAAELGAGDSVLGAKLMSSFLYALAEADRVPAQLLFVNGGVRLTTANTPVREHLARLADRGSKIASCGICLDFYGLKDQLIIGEITNMYAIVEACQNATRCITL